MKTADTSPHLVGQAIASAGLKRRYDPPRGAAEPTPASHATNAARLLARAAGYINLQIASRHLSRIGLREAAKWAREAAGLLDSAADARPRTSIDPD